MSKERRNRRSFLATDEGVKKLIEAQVKTGYTQQQLANKAGVSTDSVKNIFNPKFNRKVSGDIIIAIANILHLHPRDIVGSEWDSPVVTTKPKQVDSGINPPNDKNLADLSSRSDQRQLLPEFELLIRDRTKIFCGREFVFDAIEKFFREKPNGYFIVVGDAGMGKTAILAKFIVDHPEAICFFSIRADGINRPDLFLKIVRQQLIQRYNLQTADDADFSTLLTEVSETLTVGDRLVIVVDALDEVDQNSSGNLLSLPYILPERVYFLLSRRPYNQDDKRLYFSPSISTQELDLRQHSDKSKQDVKKYIWQFFNNEEYKNALNQWIQRKKVLSIQKFVDDIALKSEENFMYLRYVVPAIADGFYDDTDLNNLPIGLEGYYYNHWQLMGMTTKPLPKNKIEIIYIMSELREALSRKELVEFSDQDELTVQEVLDGWVQFLHKQENIQPICYRFYHQSFIDFLHRQDIVQAAEVSLLATNRKLADRITKGLFGDE